MMTYCPDCRTDRAIDLTVAKGTDPDDGEALTAIRYSCGHSTTVYTKDLDPGVNVA